MRALSVLALACGAFVASACNAQVVIGHDTDDGGLADANPPLCAVPPCDHVPPPLRWYRSCPQICADPDPDAGPLPPLPPPCAPEGAPCNDRGFRCGVPLPSNGCTVLVCERDDPREHGCF